jgi:hypothetical protein
MFQSGGLSIAHKEGSAGRSTDDPSLDEEGFLVEVRLFIAIYL